MRVSLTLLVTFLFICGCEKKSSLSVHDGDVYQEDSEGNIYRIQGFKKYKIQEHKEEFVKDKFQKTVVRNMYDSNHTFDVLMKYIDDDCFYKIKFRSKDDNFDETELFKRWIKDSDKSYTIIFQEFDGINVKELMLSRKGVKTVVLDSMKLVGYDWEGKLNISKTLFNEIYDYTVTYNLPDNLLKRD